MLLFSSQLFQDIPVRLKGCQWRLIYSTMEHGISMNTLFRKSEKFGPNILVIQTMDGAYFGAFATETWAIHPKYFGSGESFLFTFYPEYKAYRWSGTNEYFLLAKPGALAVGGGLAHFSFFPFPLPLPLPLSLYVMSTITRINIFICATGGILVGISDFGSRRTCLPEPAGNAPRSIMSRSPSRRLSTFMLSKSGGSRSRPGIPAKRALPSRPIRKSIPF